MGLARKRHILQSVSDKTSILEEDEDTREERDRETYDRFLALGKHDQNEAEDGDENGDGDGDGDANEDEDGNEESDEYDAEDGDEHDQGRMSSVVSSEGAIADVGVFDEPPSLQAGRNITSSALAPPFPSFAGMLLFVPSGTHGIFNTFTALDVTPPPSEDERVRLIAQVTVCSKITRSLYDSLQSMPGQRFREGSFPS
ncbi:hypothetical protein QFC24_003680 [Naganishia onofrii]|uniref:Uncharacterized protein n=1 Tax=Naganishia onofrii TaxID=1851511 RepID=A0ACC2XJ99_9TREE|nr:hypothetical protein QFC24_003680 [Naganishia onofrii]